MNHEYGICLTKCGINELKGMFDAVILGVAHREFLDVNVREFLSDGVNGVVYDVKGVVNRKWIDGRL